MYYYIYQITNLVNNKIYVGVHRTHNLEDGYMSSGKVIKYAIEKYGLENFHKNILEFFTNSEEMYAKEKEIVNDEFLLRGDVYNLRRGGYGGFDFINNDKEQHRLDSSRGGKKGGIIVGKLVQSTMSFEERSRRAKLAAKTKRENGTHQSFLGKNHSDETKKQMSKSAKGKQDGEKNSQFGKMWIYHLETLESIKIYKDEPIPKDWVKGRKMK